MKNLKRLGFAMRINRTFSSCARSLNLFKTFADKDGMMDINHLTWCLRAKGLIITRRTCQEYLDKNDVNGNHVIDFEEFERLVSGIENEKPSERDLFEVFTILDKNGNGVIDRDEIRELMVAPNMRKFSKEECDRLFGVGGEEVTFERFKKFVSDAHNTDIGFKLLDTYRVK